MTKMSNKLHAEYGTETDKLVVQYGSGAVGVKDSHEAFKAALDEELALLEIIRRSDLTLEIKEQDRVRDDVYKGLVATVEGLEHHFDAAKRGAAVKVGAIIRHYGNISRMSYDQASAAFTDLNREFATPEHTALVTTLAITEWVAKLEVENQKFITLMLQRYHETEHAVIAGRMKVARREVDKRLRAMLDRIDAAAVLLGTGSNPDAAAFIHDYNEMAERYKLLLAQAQGRRAAGRKEGDEEIDWDTDEDTATTPEPEK
jgi:BMFP domain-containing protein YqiC